MEIFLIPIFIISFFIVLITIAKTIQYIFIKRIGFNEILSGIIISMLILLLIYFASNNYQISSYILFPFLSIIFPFSIYVASNFSNNKLFNFIGNSSLIMIVSSTVLCVAFFKYLFEIPNMSS